MVLRSQTLFAIRNALVAQRRSIATPAVSSPAVSSLWNKVPVGPPDAILGLNTAFRADTNAQKVNLGVGAYRTEDGKPYVLPVVRRMEQKIVSDENSNHEYIPQSGLKDFVSASARLALGADSNALAENRVSSVQALSGTGSLRLGLAFIHSFLGKDTPIYLPDPTWSNHHNIVVHTGLPEARAYTYYDNASRGINMDGLLADLRSAPARSAVLLHACCHNPTGSDLTLAQWEQVLQVVEERDLLPFFDSAYQGFGTGSLDADGAAVRMFEEAGRDMLVACSFAKSMGLYGERVGALHFVCSEGTPVQAVTSQLERLVRAMYSSPPLHGAKVASMILNDPVAFKEWEGELVKMSGRIMNMRQSLKSALDELKTPGKWNHILDQVGMFSFTGLTADDVDYIRENYSIYMTRNGRISMAGLTSANVQYVAEAIHDAITRENRA